MAIRETIIFIVIGSVALLGGCAGTSETDLTFDPPAHNSMIDVAKCAARLSGWTVTSVDQQGLSATETSGMDNVPITMNVLAQPGSKTLVITISSPRGADESYLADFANKALGRCGAKNVQRSASGAAPN
jgi:hypothetical protein